MKCRNQLRAAVIEDAASKPRNRIERSQQRLSAELAQRDNHFRLDDVDLLKQKRLARLDFVRFGIAVLRRPALDDVGDVDVLALEIDRLDDLRQQLSRPSDERNALEIFIPAGGFPDEHQRGVRVAGAEDNLRPSERVELAARAVANLGPHSQERLRWRREHAQRFLDEFKASKERKTTVHTKTKSFILRKMGPFLNCDEEQGENHESESP